MHPFDLRQMLLEKHAQHVVLIHFPIALFIAGVGLDFAAQRTKRSELGIAAYVNLFLAAVTVVPAVATGLAAWQWALEGHQVKGILLLHLVFGVASAVVIWMVWWIHFLRAAKRCGKVAVFPVTFGVRGRGALGDYWPSWGIS